MLIGASKVTVAPPLFATAWTARGGVETPIGATGVTVADAEEMNPSPMRFVAYTINVYDCVFARPVTTSGELRPDTFRPPGDDTTV